jgi:phospholipid transport system substrate-binding protein
MLLLGAAIFLGQSNLAVAQKPSKKEAKKIHKVIKTVINAIRYDKDDLAAKQIEFATMTQLMMGDAWAKASPKERAELVDGVQLLVQNIGFQKGRDVFKHLDAIIYGDAERQGNEVHCPVTIVIHRNYKKTEIPMRFVMQAKGKKFKITDTITAGERSSEGIHEDEILPLLDEGGIPSVLVALRKKVAKLK